MGMNLTSAAAAAAAAE
jgi:beta-glucosidase